MITEIKWQDDFLVGIKEIDILHKELLERINLCIQGANGRLGKIKIDQLMLSLFKYTQWHFRCEEALMGVYEYPEIKTHIEEHDDILILLGDEIKKVQTNMTYFQETPKFFLGWFGAHTLSSDMEMADYLRGTSHFVYAAN